MEASKEHSEAEDLEEDMEDRGGGEGQENDCQQGGHSSVKDGGSQRAERLLGPLRAASACHGEGVPDVGGVVHAETGGQDDVDTGHHVCGVEVRRRGSGGGRREEDYLW